MERVRSMPVGVVIERREIDNPWQDHVWRAVAVIPGAPEIAGWKLLVTGPGWTRYHAATLPLDLHHKETAAYRANLSNEQPVVYIGLRAVVDSAASFEVAPFLATASPYEAQDYLDSSEDIIEGVPMPEGMVAWVQDFIDAHHVDEPFEKRKRTRLDPDEVGFGRRPDDRPPPSGRGRDGRRDGDG